MPPDTESLPAAPILLLAARLELLEPKPVVVQAAEQDRVADCPPDRGRARALVERAGALEPDRAEKAVEWPAIGRGWGALHAELYGVERVCGWSVSLPFMPGQTDGVEGVKSSRQVEKRE